MARGPSKRSMSSDKDKGAAKAPAKPAELNTFKMWFDEHWHGWVKPVSGIALLALAYFLYTYHVVGEGFAGPLLVAVIVLGSIIGSALPALPALESRNLRLAFGAFLLVWAVGAGYPSLRAALPKKTLGEIHLSDTKEHTLALPGEHGPYELDVGGRLKGAAEVEASYRLTVSGNLGNTEEVAGTLKRAIFRQRVGRRGGTAAVTTERTQNVHRTGTVVGDQIKVTADGIDDQLEDGLFVTVVDAGPNPVIFLVLAALCVLGAIYWDYKLASPKLKTYLAMAAGTTAVFAYQFPTEATPNFLVPPAVGAVVIAFVTGGLGGALASFITRSFKPQPKVVKKGAR